MKNNILILSAGRRVELVEAFVAEAKALLNDVNVYAVDFNPDISSACKVADDCFKAPRVTDQEYLQFLKQLCVEKSIGLVIPTIDTELLPLAKIKHHFTSLGIHIAISSEGLVASCRNKNLTAKVFEALPQIEWVDYRNPL